MDAQTLEESTFGALLSFPSVIDGALYNQAFDVGTARTFGYQQSNGFEGVLVLPADETYHKQCSPNKEPLGSNPYINWLISQNDTRDYILIIDRGTCMFTDKISYAQQLGSSAVIICDSVVRDVTTMGGMTSDIVIPSIMLQNVHCHTLMAHLGVHNWDPSSSANMKYPSIEQFNWTSSVIQWTYNKALCHDNPSPVQWCYDVDVDIYPLLELSKDIKIWEFDTGTDAYFNITFNVIGAHCNAPAITFESRDIDNNELLISDMNGPIASCPGTTNSVCADWVLCVNNELLPMPQIADGDSYQLRVLKPSTVNNLCDVLSMDAILTITCLNSTFGPTNAPSQASISPSNHPTKYPTATITAIPSVSPTNIPTNIPTNVPTHIPTNNPIETNNPSLSATSNPSKRPTTTEKPSNSPTVSPTKYSVTVTAQSTEQHRATSSVSINNIANLLLIMLAVIVLCLNASCCTVIFFLCYKRRKQRNKAGISEVMEMIGTGSIDDVVQIRIEPPGSGSIADVVQMSDSDHVVIKKDENMLINVNNALPDVIQNENDKQTKGNYEGWVDATDEVNEVNIVMGNDEKHNDDPVVETENGFIITPEYDTSSDSTTSNQMDIANEKTVEGDLII